MQLILQPAHTHNAAAGELRIEESDQACKELQIAGEIKRFEQELIKLIFSCLQEDI